MGTTPCEICRAYSMYAYCMVWKMKQLLKLTFGIWNRELIEAMSVRQLADEFDENPNTIHTKYAKRRETLQHGGGLR